MSDNSITRVHYFEGQFLRTQDFTDEQAYHVAMRRRHNIAHHSWGIVSGLQVVLEEGNFYVQPGVAVDGFGRELILAQKQTLSSSAFLDKDSTELDVWLVYDLRGSDQAPAGYSGCGNGNGNGSSFYRWQETARALLEKTDTDFPDRRLPKDLSLRDRNFTASQTPPDNPESNWPVFLGQIINDPANQQQPLAVNLDNRPYAGLVGEAIDAPSGRARVQIGAEKSEDTRRFVVSTRDETAVQASAGSQGVPWTPRIEVDVSGEVSVRGDASLYGDLIMEGGAIEFGAGTARDPGAPPWNIYHRERSASRTTDDLLIEMAGPPGGGASGGNEVVIGAWFKGPDETGAEKETFHPCLTIVDNGTVKVAGNLIVNGRVTAQSVAPTQFTQEALNASTSALMSGILGTSSRLSPIPPTATVTQPILAMMAAGTDESVSGETLADRIADDAAVRDAFVERMKQSHPDEAKKLRKALS